jgi:uncharacterized protein involved in outer membrane biogenesis
MSNALLYIAGLIALALAALFAVPYFIDWNGYRGVFEEEATRILGREVRVGGNVNVRLLPSPYVSFEKLRIADPTGATGEPFFRAESFTMRLSAPPLLKGIIEANEVVLEKPFLRLAVDGEGGGNWSSFSIAPGTLPFVPAGVTLQSVKIADGTVALYGPKGIGFAELGGLNGELKADSVDGPFAFKGTAKWDGGDRDVRIATAAMDAAGVMRFKATVRGTSASNNIYILDGRVEDLKGRPRVAGDISAKLALAPGELPIAVAPEALAPGPTGVPSAEPTSPAPGAPSFGLPLATKANVPMIDAKAHVVGDAKGLRVDDIALSFEHIGQPQLISGSATAAWSEALSVDMALSSRWLDLDRVAKSKEGSGTPLETARNFIMAMMEALPPTADSKIRFDLDQATLGGEAVSDIRLEVARNQGVLLVSNVRAGLPGGARLTLDGAVAEAATGQAFRGDVTLHGTSFARFLDWAMKEKSLAEALRNEGPFSLQGQLAMSERSIDLTDAGVEIGGRAITGEAHYARKERPRLALVLEGGEIDAGQLWPVGVNALTSVLAGGKADGAADAKPAFAWLDPATMDLHMHLRAGVLLTERGRLRDVDIDVGLEEGRLGMRAVKFATADGLQLELEGNIAEAMQAPRGALQGIVAAPSRDAYAGLLHLLGLPDDLRQRADALAALVPMRVAGTVELGQRTGGVTLAADGSVQGSGRLTATARLDGGFANWRAAPADFALTIDSADVASVVAGLGGRAVARPAGDALQAGEIFLKAVGTPGKGMTATASAKAPALFLGYDGRVVIPDDGTRALDGELRVSARALRDVLAVAGLGGGAALAETPVVGTLKLTSASHATELAPQGLTIGGSRVDGSLALAYPSEGPAIVTGEVEVDAATVPGLLALVLDRRQAAEAPAAEPLTAGKSIWPEHGFDFAALDGVEGKLSVGFDSLALAEGMSIAKARAQVELAPGKVAISQLAGKVLGGDLNANVVLERAPGGASLTTDLSIADMRIRQAPAGSDASQPPHASLSLAFAGRASTPGALVSVVAGKGELKLSDLSVHAPTPLAVVATAEAVLNGEAGGSGEQLVAALRTQFDTAEVAVGPRAIAIDISDGAAKLALVTLEAEAGTTKVETTVDLASLVVDSAWRVEPRQPPAPTPAAQTPGQTQAQPEKPRHGLPAVGVVYTGALANAWALEPHITADALERELSIRRMELDADQLERLHRADAERARRDYERRRALESDQTAPAPPAPTPVPAPPNGAAIAPVAPQSSPGDTGAVDVTAPQATGTTPVIPPSSASAAGVVVPPAPGQDPQQTFGAAPIDPAAPAEATIAPPVTQNGTYRPRRSQRYEQPGEQVLRSLQNN